MGWISPTGFVDPNSKWTDEALAYNGNTGDGAFNAQVDRAYWLELTHDGITDCSKVRIYTWSDVSLSEVYIDVYYGGSWHNIFFDLVNRGTWVEMPIGSSETVTAARIKWTQLGAYFKIQEFEFWKDPITHQGTATLSGVGLLSSIGSFLLNASATLSGTGVLSAIGSFAILGAATLSGAGSLVASAIMTYGGKAALSGIGALTAIARMTFAGVATLAGVGTLTGAGLRILSGAVTFLGTGLLSAFGYIVIRRFGYSLEVHTSAGALISMLKNPLRIRYVRTLNEPHQLTFSLPADDDDLDDITPGNEIWLRNLKDGSVVHKFKLFRRADRKT